MMIPTLKGKLVNLRQLKRSDAAIFQRYANNRDVAYYLEALPSPYTMAEAYKWVKTTHSLARKKIGYGFGIEEIASGEIVGMIGLRNINTKDRNAEVGYWIGKPFWNRGYGGEALPLILRYAFKELRLRRLYAIVHSQNIASSKILEKTGFIREGIWRKASFKNNRWRDVYGYGILKSEFKMKHKK